MKADGENTEEREDKKSQGEMDQEKEEMMERSR